jgi:putative glutamine amidotransferase
VHTAIPGAIAPRAASPAHQQGVATLAPGLRAEAHAPDGLIEAFSLPDAPGWLHAVQWHPEWQYAHNPASLALFTAFGEACRQYRQARTGQPALPTPQGEAR